MTQPVDIEALRQLLERATAGPWAYRPQEHDDWGFIRTTRATEDGWHPVVARANDVSVHEDHDAHRAAKTDPAEGNARLIVAAVNALPSLLTELEALRAERGRMAEGHREAVARCIQIIFETRDGFLSPEYATDQPISSVMERFACDRCIDAISSEFAMGSNEQRQLVGRPTHLEEYRASLKEPSQ